MPGLGTRYTPVTGAGVRRVSSLEDLPVEGSFTGELIQVGDDGDSKPALYQWNIDEWIKTADTDSTVVDIVFPILHNLSSQVNGNQTIFDIGATPRTGSLLVFVGGLAMTPGSEEIGGDYTLATRYVTFHTAPIVGANVLAYYC